MCESPIKEIPGMTVDYLGKKKGYVISEGMAYEAAKNYAGFLNLEFIERTESEPFFKPDQQALIALVASGHSVSHETARAWLFEAFGGEINSVLERCLNLIDPSYYEEEAYIDEATFIVDSIRALLSKGDSSNERV